MNKPALLFAFAEQRIANKNEDSGNINVVYKISRNHGKTWSRQYLVCDKARDTCGNPTVSVDQTRSEIHIFMNSNKGYKKQFEPKSYKEKYRVHDRRVLYRKAKYSSSIKKLSLSPIRDLTMELQKKYLETFDLVGPGVGIVLSSGSKKGRIIVPAARRSFYSDNHGITWKESELLPRNLSSETAIVELPNGKVYRNDKMHSKNKSVKNRRMVSISSDKGVSYKGLRRDFRLMDPRTQGSLYRYTKNHIIFSNCDSGVNRRNLTLRLSNGTLNNSLADSLRLHKNSILLDKDCGYSSVSKTRNFKIGILYEKKSPNKDLYTFKNSKGVKVDIKAPKDIVFTSLSLSTFGK